MRKSLLIPVVAALVLGGCSWGVRLTDAGRAESTNCYGPMDSCARLGTATVSESERLGPIKRDAINMRDELDVLARNEAARMGGDTVHPLGDPAKGSQVWGIYHCGTTNKGGAPARTSGAAGNAGGVQTFPIESGGSNPSSP